MSDPNPDPSRRLLLHGSRFDVVAVNVRRRDGREVQRELVVHPGCAVILPVLDDGRIVMIRNARFSVGRELWELPAGTLDGGEAPDACAARELIEETGYRAARIEPLCAFLASPGICTERMHAFVANDLTHVGQQLEPTESIRVQPLALDQVLARIRSGEIEDAKTIAAVLFYATFVHARSSVP